MESSNKDKGMLDVLTWMLEQSKEKLGQGISSLDQWKRVSSENSKNWPDTTDHAIAGGVAASCVAYAFLSGYRSALQFLFPHLDPGKFASFCISEIGGNRPRDIKTSVKRSQEKDRLFIDGQKQYITGASQSQIMFVAVSQGLNEQGKNRIKMIEVNSTLPGVKIEPMDSIKFVPEIEHGKIKFTNVQVEEKDILPGDGYDSYIKPFRYIEDVHVTAALLGYFFRISVISDWPTNIREKIIALLTLSKQQMKLIDNTELSFITYAGFQSQFSDLLKELNPLWQNAPSDLAEKWERDKAILTVAEQARKIRLKKAWQRFIPN